MSTNPQASTSVGQQPGTAATTVGQEIFRRIRERGAITFAEFMEVALYWPGDGYYTRPRTGSDGAGPFGPAGDYYTSPMAHPAFGALLAVQLYQFWLLLGRPDPFHVVEAGAGNGQLCRDVCNAAANLPGRFAQSLRYLCLDRRPVAATSDDFPGAQIVAADLPLRHLRGCIIANELLDAFPVHQVRVVDGRLREVYVGLAGGAAQDTAHSAPPLVEVLDDLSSPALAARLEELGITLAEGQTAEVNLGLEPWAMSVGAALKSGFVLTIDYGRGAEELYSPRVRFRGTLVTYHNHVQTDAPFRHVGRQDMTSQVDFSSVVNAGRRAALAPLGLTTQAHFLRNLGLDEFQRRVASEPATVPRRDIPANRAGLQALAREDGLGAFRVLVQARGLPDEGLLDGARLDGKEAPITGATLWGLQASPEARRLAAHLPLPQLTTHHIRLTQGWGQPVLQEFDVEDLWNGPLG